MINFNQKKKPLLMAEVSANHNKSINKAKKLILEAKKFGVDKFINEKVNRLCDFGK